MWISEEVLLRRLRNRKAFTDSSSSKTYLIKLQKNTRGGSKKVFYMSCFGNEHMWVKRHNGGLDRARLWKMGEKMRDDREVRKAALVSGSFPPPSFITCLCKKV